MYKVQDIQFSEFNTKCQQKFLHCKNTKREFPHLECSHLFPSLSILLSFYCRKYSTPLYSLTEDTHIPASISFSLEDDGSERFCEVSEERVLQFHWYSQDTIEEFTDVIVVLFQTRNSNSLIDVDQSHTHEGNLDI